MIRPVPVPKRWRECTRRIHATASVRALKMYIFQNIQCFYDIYSNNVLVSIRKFFTAASETPTTEKPNLIAVESVVWAHLGSQVAQAAQSMNDVQRISTKTACVVLIPGWTVVTQWPTDEFETPSLNNSGGVTACSIKITIKRNDGYHRYTRVTYDQFIINIWRQICITTIIFHHLIM